MTCILTLSTFWAIGLNASRHFHGRAVLVLKGGGRDLYIANIFEVTGFFQFDLDAKTGKHFH